MRFDDIPVCQVTEGIAILREPNFNTVIFKRTIPVDLGTSPLSMPTHLFFLINSAFLPALMAGCLGTAMSSLSEETHPLFYLLALFLAFFTGFKWLYYQTQSRSVKLGVLSFKNANMIPTLMKKKIQNGPEGERRTRPGKDTNPEFLIIESKYSWLRLQCCANWHLNSFLVDIKGKPDDYEIKEGHPVPELSEMKKFFRWWIDSTKGRIDVKPTKDTTLRQAQEFVPGFYFTTGNDIPEPDRKDLYYVCCLPTARPSIFEISDD